MERLEKQFKNLIIDDVSLASLTPLQVDQNLVELVSLREQLVNLSLQLKDENVDKTRALNLLDACVKEIRVLEQFSSTSELIPTLEDILMDEEVELELDKPQKTISLPPDPCGIVSPPSRSISFTSNTNSNQYFAPKVGNYRTDPCPFPSIPPLRFKHLDKVTDLTFGLDMQRQIGMLTTFAVHYPVLCAGTSRGLVLVVDLGLDLDTDTSSLFPTTILGDPESEKSADYGIVTCISISPDRTHVLVGYEQGLIVLWDLTKVINRPPSPTVQVLTNPTRTILPISLDSKRDGHLRDKAILHLNFVNNMEFLSADDSGTIMYHVISRLVMIYSISSVRLHGQRNPSIPTTIFSMQVLHGFLNDATLFAFTTPYKLIIMSLKPEPQVRYKIVWTNTFLSRGIKPNLEPVPSRQASVSDIPILESNTHPLLLSCIAWRPTELHPKRQGEPTLPTMLAISWGTYVAFVQAELKERPKSPVMAPEVEDENDENAQVIQQERMEAQMARQQSRTKLEFSVIKEYQLPETVCAIQWLTPETVLLLTSTEKIMVLDVVSWMVVDQTNVKEKKIAHHDFYSHPLQRQNDNDTTFSQVAYHPSFIVPPGSEHLFLMSFRDFYVGAIWFWRDRVLAMLKQSGLEAALVLALEYFESTPVRMGDGLAPDSLQRQEEVANVVIQILNSAVDQVCQGKRDLGALTLLVDACMAIHRPDLLLGQYYEQLESASHVGELLDRFEPYILQDRMRDLTNPDILQALVKRYVQTNEVEKLEECLTHLNTHAMDIDHLINLCRAYKLTGALTYIYNVALFDYISPIVEVLPLLQRMVHGADDTRCYQLYVYLAYVFSGKSFPTGLPVTPPVASASKSDCYNFIFSPTHQEWPVGNVVKYGKEPFPYMTLLIQYDPEEFFKMLGTSFEDASLNGQVFVRPLGISQDLASTVFEPESRASSSYIDLGESLYGGFEDAQEINRQFILDTLINLMCPDIRPFPAGQSFKSTTDFTEKEKTLLFTFLSRSLIKYSTFVSFDNGLLDGILNALTNMYNPNTVVEREQAAKLLMTQRLSLTPSIKLQSAVEEWVGKFEMAGFHSLCEDLYMQTKQYERVLQTYLLDSSPRRFQLFNQIDLLLQQSLSDVQKEALEKRILDHVAELVDLDPISTARLISKNFPKRQMDVVEKLHDSHGALEYLSQVMNSDDEDWIFPEICEKYLTLLAEERPQEMLASLNRLATRAVTKALNLPFSLDSIRPLVMKPGLEGAHSWILEKSGDVMGALRVLLEKLRQLLEEGLQANAEIKRLAKGKGLKTMSDANVVLAEIYGSNEIQRRRVQLRNTLKEAESTLMTVLNLCQRNSNRLNPEDREAMWMAVMDLLVEWQRRQATHTTLTPTLNGKILPPTSLSRSPSPTSRPTTPTGVALAPDGAQLPTAIKDFTRIALNSMVGYMSLPIILRRLLKEQEGAEYGEFRDVIASFLHSYNYEETLLETTIGMVVEDMFNVEATAVKRRSRALRPDKNFCIVCRSPINVRSLQEGDKVVLFECGHMSHHRCSNGNKCPSCEKIVAVPGTPTRKATPQPIDMDHLHLRVSSLDFKPVSASRHEKALDVLRQATIQTKTDQEELSASPILPRSSSVFSQFL